MILTAEVLDSAVPAKGRMKTWQAEEGRANLPWVATEREIVDNIVVTDHRSSQQQSMGTIGDGPGGDEEDGAPRRKPSVRMKWYLLYLRYLLVLCTLYTQYLQGTDLRKSVPCIVCRRLSVSPGFVVEVFRVWRQTFFVDVLSSSFSRHCMHGDKGNVLCGWRHQIIALFPFFNVLLNGR